MLMQLFNVLLLHLFIISVLRPSSSIAILDGLKLKEKTRYFKEEKKKKTYWKRTQRLNRKTKQNS